MSSGKDDPKSTISDEEFDRRLNIFEQGGRSDGKLYNVMTVDRNSNAIQSPQHQVLILQEQKRRDEIQKQRIIHQQEIERAKQQRIQDAQAAARRGY